MSKPVVHEADGATTRAQQLAGQRVKEALAALLKGDRAGRMYAGTDNADARSARERFRRGYLNGIHEALQDVPMLIIEVTPDGFFLGDVLVVEASERRGDVAEQLFSEGLRVISIESGASDDELSTLADLLLAPWASKSEALSDLASAAWAADFAHIFVEVVESLSEREPDELGESPIVRQLAGLVAELNAQAGEAGDADMARIRQDELAVLLKVRDQVRFSEGGNLGGEVQMAGSVSAGLKEEARRCAEDRDMVQSDIAGLLAACLETVTEPERASVIGAALYAYVVNAVLAEGETSTLIQRTAELLDRDLTPQLAFREQVRDAAASLAQEPTRGRLSRLFHQADARASRGLAFTLFQLLPGEDEAIAVAPVLPSWAVAILADTVLLRAAPEPLVAVDVPRRFLASGDRGSVLLGLAMAARQKDARLIEPALAQVAHPADDVREAALVALRHHQTPRIREAVRAALDDDAEGVRLEALRYSVAYRDADAVAWITTRLLSPALARLRAVEVRALCIALGRLHGANAQPLLVELAEGIREARHPEVAPLALQGLKAIGTDSARAALLRIGRVVPALADESQTLLRAMQ
jgi:plasmid stabilization system protein ParE